MRELGGILTTIMAADIGIFSYHLNEAGNMSTIVICAGLILLGVYGFCASLLLTLE